MQSLDDLIGFNTVRTSKKISRYLNLNLKPYQITTEQWSVLKRLYGEDHVNQKDLSERSDKDQATLTKILDLLEKKKYISRTPNPEDRRSYLIDITPQGAELVERLTPFVEGLFENMTTGLSPEHLTVYFGVLRTLHSNLEKLDKK